VNSTYQLILSGNAIKFMAKQEIVVRERIRKALIGLSVRPPIGDIKPMKGYDGLYRLRVGNYRVLFEIQHHETTVYIRAIDSRGGIYK
jgi:mRNA interferase RelE/StbE